FADLSLEKLRLYLAGDNQVVAGMYDLIFNHTLQVTFRALDMGPNPPTVTLAPETCLHQVGFEAEDSLLPYPPQAFLGYRLLTEFFTFPNKFHFVDLGGWSKVAKASFPTRLEVVLFLNRTQPNLEQGVDANTFRTGCTPVINLFEQVAEPIALNQARY